MKTPEPTEWTYNFKDGDVVIVTADHKGDFVVKSNKRIARHEMYVIKVINTRIKDQKREEGQ